MDPLDFEEFVFRMCEQVDALAPQGMGEQDLGGQPRDGESGILQQARALE
jgi:hypothetical protein